MKKIATTLAVSALLVVGLSGCGAFADFTGEVEVVDMNDRIDYNPNASAGLKYRQVYTLDVCPVEAGAVDSKGNPQACWSTHVTSSEYHRVSVGDILTVGKSYVFID